MRKNGTIDLDDAWKNIQPFDDPPNVEEIKQSIGAYLKYDAFEIEIAMPSNFDYENTWNRDFSKKLRQAGAKNPLSKIRLGGSFLVMFKVWLTMMCQDLWQNVQRIVIIYLQFTYIYLLMGRGVFGKKCK